MDDPDPGNLIFQIILLFVLILLNAFFAMSEIAIISLNDTKIAKMAEEGNKKAKQVLKLTADSSGFLSTIQIGVTLAGFLTSASASQTFVDMLSGAIGKISVLSGIPAGVINGFSVVVITLITSYFSLVLGELAPKRIAMQAPEKVSFKVVGILLGFKKITKPFVKILSLSTNGLVRLLGYDPNASEEPVTEEEIRMMVDVGGEKGVIEDSQKEMINNIFEFDDLDAGDIMTHRTDMTAAEISDPLSEIVSLSMDNGYSRIPVYDDDPDNIVGIAYVKDLLKYIGTDLPEDVTLRDIIREPVFVPESMPCGDLFFQKAGDFPERKEISEFYLKLRHFMNMFERVDENYVLYSDFDETDRFCLHLYCVNPSVNLQECLERGKSTIFFSATLLPVNYYKNLLSSKKDNYAVYADSAFREEQRLLFIGRDVSSLYTRRTLGEFHRIALYIQQVLRAKKLWEGWWSMASSMRWR